MRYRDFSINWFCTTVDHPLHTTLPVTTDTEKETVLIPEYTLTPMFEVPLLVPTAPLPATLLLPQHQIGVSGIAPWPISSSQCIFRYHILKCHFPMMTSSKGNIFRVTGPLCGEFTGPGEFPAQRPVTWSFDVFFDLRLNKRLSKQPWGWWFETPSWSFWRHRNANKQKNVNYTPLPIVNVIFPVKQFDKW